MKPASATESFLRRQRRRSRGTLLAWAMAMAVLAQAWIGAAQLGWIDVSALWAVVPAVASGWLLVRWTRRAWRLNEQAVAREVDARWELRARLESAVELSGSDTAVAIAQRADTARRLESKKPTGTLAWIGGITAALLGLGLVGAEQIALVQPPHLPQLAPLVVVVAKPVPVVPKATPPPPEPWRASISWKSPERLISATAAAEIPLVAQVDSNKGYHSMVLEVAVNGTHTNSYPLAPAVLGAAAQPGGSDVKLSLFLDETGAKPYDVVSYFLQGSANLPPDFPVVVSRLQFVGVTPAESPPGGDERYTPGAREMLRRLNELKQGQVQLIERNFDLAHAAPAGFTIEVTPENAGIAPTQSRLAQTADEARAAAVQIHAPDRVATDLAQAGASMTRAGVSIAARDHAAAAPVQANALAQIVDAERTFRTALDAASPSQITDPAKEATAGGLKPRGQTPAGRLELLGRRQGENNRRLQQLPSAAADLPAIAAEQAAIAREVEKLAGERALVDLVQKTLGAAVKATAEAARQLGLNDPQAAREPAAEAQALLQHAVEVQENEGRKAASALLEQVRQELNETDRSKDPAAQQAKQDQVQRELSTEAQRQQQQGSAEAAQKLAALVKRLEESKATPQSPSSEAKDSAKSPGGSGGKNPTVFVADLRPMPGADKSTASGSATIALGPDHMTATIDVAFDHLSSKETTAFLAVGETGGTRTTVFPLGTGTFTKKSWKLEPTGNLSRDALLAALQGGGLYLELDTASYPKGELGGQFLPKRGGPPGSGGASETGEQDAAAADAAAAPENAEDSGASGEVVYQANMRVLPGASISTASGNASITLGANKSNATVDVTFTQLSSKETTAFLAVGGTGANGTAVFTLGTGRIGGKSWRFEPVGNITRAALLQALASGQLFIEIDTVTSPKGELGGPFTRKGGGGGGGGSGTTPSASRPKPAQAGGVAMPSLGTETHDARGPVIDAAMAIAESQVALAPDNSLAQTIRQLKAAATRLSGNAAGNVSSLSLLETAAQKAQVLAADPRLAGAARDIAKAASGTMDAAARKALADHAEELIEALENEDRPGAKRDEWVRRFAPEDIDPDYRKPVEDYFERLSREGATR